MIDEPQPGDGTLIDQYQEWCRVQYGMAHHDIWWPKGMQLKAGSSTLVLLGAIVGASKLLWQTRDEIPTLGRIMLSVLSAATILLGIVYAWNLYSTMVLARGRAKMIARLVKDDYQVLKGALEDPERNVEFPLIASVVYAAALTVVLVYFWS
jgi:hypothetical protein